ncbi:MAG: methylated-DNA--[protein]-cysteine S-methyltransferase [Elusimicrobiales bacterium]
MNKKILERIKEEMKKYPLFYQKVWMACLKIPVGKTRSYKWIAQKIGNPNAYRAVALALKKNPFPPYIPCHRVIRSDGKIGGYSGAGGIKRKMYLIRRERLSLKERG